MFAAQQLPALLGRMSERKSTPAPLVTWVLIAFFSRATKYLCKQHVQIVTCKRTCDTFMKYANYNALGYDLICMCIWKPFPCFGSGAEHFWQFVWGKQSQSVRMIHYQHIWKVRLNLQQACMFLKHLPALQLANYCRAKQTQKEITKGMTDLITLQTKWNDEEIALPSSDTWKSECVSQLRQKCDPESPMLCTGSVTRACHHILSHIPFIWISLIKFLFWQLLNSNTFLFLPLNFLPQKVQITALLWPVRGANKHNIAKLGQSSSGKISGLNSVES